MPARPLYKRPWFWLVAAGVVAIVVLAVVLPVYFVVIKPDQNSTSGNAASGSSGGSGSTGSGKPGAPGSKPQNAITFGGDGSTVTKEDGSTFTYKNPFGGYWVSNTENPFDNSARPNSWTPALNETWTWGKDRIWGVNLQR